jgi:glyoxylase-like metal-dependent hydrolase (beta-lactamase superfamily II)
MPKERAEGLGWYSVQTYDVDTELRGGEELDLAAVQFEVVAIPGHSPDHVAFAADGALFSGDLVFAGSVGRVDLPGGDWEALLASTRALGDRFPPETTIYPGHGPPTTLGAELERNPFLAELRA